MGAMGESFDEIVDDEEGLGGYFEGKKAALRTLNDAVLSVQNNPEPIQTTDNPEPSSTGVDYGDDEDFDDLGDEPPDLGDEGGEDGGNPEENNGQNDGSVERGGDKAPTLTAELLKDTDTKKHLLNILSKHPFSTKSQYILNLGDTPEKRLNTIFQKVHTTVNSYLRRQFDILESSPEHDFIDKTVSPAIEWFLLETLRQGGNEGNNQALNGVLDVYNDMNNVQNPGDWKDLGYKITGITKQVNGIYGRVKRIQKVLDCFALHKNWIEKENRDQYKELSNPYEFYMYLEKGDLWDKFKDTDLKDVTIPQLQLTEKEGTESQNLSDEQKLQLITQLGNIDVQENSSKTTENILKVLDIGEPFLKQSGEIKQHVLDLARVANDVTSQFGVNLLGILDNPIGNFLLSLIGFSGGFSGLMIALNGNPTAEGSDQTSEDSEKPDTKKDKVTKEIEKINQFLKDPTFSEKQQELTEIKKKLEEQEEKPEDSNFIEDFDKIRKEIGIIRLQCKKAEVENILNDKNMNGSSAKTDLEKVKQQYQDLNQKIADEADSQDQDKLSGADLSTQIDAIDLAFEKGKVIFLKERLQGLAKDPTKLEGDDEKRITDLLGKCEDIESKSIEDIQGLIKDLILFIQEKDLDFIDQHRQLEKYLKGGTKYPNGLEKYDGKGKLLFEDSDSYLNNIGAENIGAFKEKLIYICQNDLGGINPNWLMLHIFHESGFNPKAKHSTSGALGLIQILPDYVEKYGTTVEQLENMSAVEQLDIIKEFYKDKASKIHSYEDIALLGFAPNRFDQKDNPDCILYMDVDSDHPYDIDHNGNITMGEFFAKKREYIQQYVPSDLQNQFIAPQSGNNTQQTGQ